MTVTYWDTSYLGFEDLADLATTTGTIDGRTWTNHGTANVVYAPISRLSQQRYVLANAIANELASWEVTVTPYPPTHGVSPPHVWLEPDNPFYDPATFGTAYEVWAYQVMLAVAGKIDASYDWFERVASKLDTAVRTVAGARLEQMDAPEDQQIGDGRSYMVAAAHVTIKQAKGT